MRDLYAGVVLPPDWTAPGLRPLAYAVKLGLLGPGTLAVHGVQLDAQEVEVLAASGAALCLCPRSNRNLGVGVPPVRELMESGALLCLGTDGLTSNRDLDVRKEAVWLRETMAIAKELNADVGKVILYGLVLVVPGAIIGGPIFAKYISKNIIVPLPEGAVTTVISKDGRDLPNFGGTLLLTLLPLILMRLRIFSAPSFPSSSPLVATKRIPYFVGTFFMMRTSSGILIRLPSQRASNSTVTVGLCCGLPGCLVPVNPR